MKPVLCEIRDRVAYVTLNRPSAMNGITADMLAGLAEIASAIDTDDAVKAVVVTGAGEAFCVGLDIELLERAFADHAYFREVLERYRDVLLAFEALPVPVVAAVNGLARAGGFELILACDLAVIAHEARIADHHLSFGIVPGGGATQRLARRVGRARAAEIVFTARWVGAEEAVAIGLASAAVPRARLAEQVDELVSVFRERSRGALAATKAAMSEGESLPLRRALDVEIEHFMRYLDGDAFAAEGFTAYKERRQPRWP